MLLLDLADVLRRAGLVVVEHVGWRERHHGELHSAVLLTIHHTGSEGMPGTVNIVRDGRRNADGSFLAGPLAQTALDREARWHVLASGQASHMGRGGPLYGVPKDNGNSRAIGVEVVSAGSTVTPAQRDALVRGAAAIARAYGIPVERVVGHKEWAPGRKPDPGFVAMGDLRAAIAARLNGGDGDLDANQDRMLREVHRELTQTHRNRVDGKTQDTMAGYAINADALSYQALQMLRGMAAAIDRLSAAAAGGDGVTADELRQAVREGMAAGLDVRVTAG